MRAWCGVHKWRTYAEELESCESGSAHNGCTQKIARMLTWGAERKASFETEVDVGGINCTETESELPLGWMEGQGQQNTPMTLDNIRQTVHWEHLSVAGK